MTQINVPFEKQFHQSWIDLRVIKVKFTSDYKQRLVLD